MFLDVHQHVIERRALAQEIQLGVIVVVEQATLDLRIAARGADGFAVVEGAEVTHRFVMRAQAGLHQRPVRDQALQHDRLVAGQQFLQAEACRRCSRAARACCLW